MNVKKTRIILCAAVLLLFIGSLSIWIANAISDYYSPETIDPTNIGMQLDGRAGYISFLGDSITTFDGCSNSTEYNSTIGKAAPYYNSSKMHVTSTWWYKMAEAADMRLCVNNSWSARRVTDTKPGITSGVAAASELDNDIDGIVPDAIVIYLGTNDVANGISVSDFAVAYAEMLDIVKECYPRAKLYCCTILPESRTVGREAEVAEYNKTIRNLAKIGGGGNPN